MLNFGVFLPLSKNMASEKKKKHQASPIPFVLLIPSFQALERNRANPSHDHTS